MINNLKVRAFVGLIFSTIFWGLSYVFSKGLIEAEMNNITIIFFRSLIATACLVTIMVATKKVQFIRREHLKTVLLLSLFQPFMYFIFELASMRYNSATLTSLIISLVPLFVPFALWVVEKEKIKPQIYAAILMSIVGVSVILLSGDGTVKLMTNPVGVLLAVCAVTCAVMYNIVARRITKHYNALVITTYQNAIGFVLFLPLFLFFEHGKMSEIPFNPQTITSLLLLGVFCSAIAYMFYLNSIKYLGVMVSTLTNNISPIYTVIGAFLLFGERLFALQLLGVAITVGSLFVGTYKRKESKK